MTVLQALVEVLKEFVNTNKLNYSVTPAFTQKAENLNTGVIIVYQTGTKTLVSRDESYEVDVIETVEVDCDCDNHVQGDLIEVTESEPTYTTSITYSSNTVLDDSFQITVKKYVDYEQHESSAKEVSKLLLGYLNSQKALSDVHKKGCELIHNWESVDYQTTYDESKRWVDRVSIRGSIYSLNTYKTISEEPLITNIQIKTEAING